MKFLIKISLLLTIALIILAGCELTAPPKEVEQPTKPIAMEDEAIVDSPDMDTEEPVNTITCDMLKSKEREKNCRQALNEVAADELYSEIRDTFDLARCDELGGGFTESCKNYIESTGIKGPVSETELKILRGAMNMVYPEVIDEEGVESEGYYDLTKCAALTVPGLKEYCEKQLNGRIEENRMYEIVGSGDVSKCDTLTIEDLKIMCKEEFGIFQEEEESTE